MKKVLLGITILSISLGVAGCASNSSAKNAIEESATEKTKTYETKKLKKADVEKVSIEDDINTVYEKLGKPLKEWSNDFVYDEMENAITRNDLLSNLPNGGDKYKELSESGKDAQEIKKLTMLQYTYTNDSGDEETALFWISPRTDQVVYLNTRSFIDENGEQVGGESSTADSSSQESYEEPTTSYSLGDSVSFSGEDGGQISVNVQSVSKATGDDFYTPEGSFFAQVSFTVTNDGTTPFDVNSTYFEFYDSLDTKSELSSRDYFSETIQAGKSAQGTAYFDVINDGETFEIYFADASWTGSYQ